MTRHIATALIAGMGFAAPQTSVADVPVSETLLHAGRQEAGTICRTSRFGHLKSAGRFRRSEIARFFVDEGQVFADWLGQVHAPQPCRIETEELDAEWMSHCVDGKWMLSRRELNSAHGKLWSVQVYGNSSDPTRVQIVATANDAMDGGEALTVNYDQSSAAARLSVRENRDGRMLHAWNAAAATLGDLREKHPAVVGMYLEPVLAKMVC